MNIKEYIEKVVRETRDACKASGASLPKEIELTIETDQNGGLWQNPFQRSGNSMHLKVNVEEVAQ